MVQVYLFKLQFDALKNFLNRRFVFHHNLRAQYFVALYYLIECVPERFHLQVACQPHCSHNHIDWPARLNLLQEP